MGTRRPRPKFLLLNGVDHDRCKTGARPEIGGEGFGDALDDTEFLLKQAVAEPGKKASDLLQVEAKLPAAKLNLRDLQNDAAGRAKAAARVAEDYVRHNPWQATGVASRSLFSSACSSAAADPVSERNDSRPQGVMGAMAQLGTSALAMSREDRAHRRAEELHLHRYRGAAVRQRAKGAR